MTYEALDEDFNYEIVSFYTDFSELKSFAKVPHYELLEKVVGIEVGRCVLETLFYYVNGRKQFASVDNTRS